jgi:Flp pilus assembly pilin Flp
MQHDRESPTGGGDEGATAVEYAILASLIAAVIVAIVLALGLQLPPIFQSVVDGLP